MKKALSILCLMLLLSAIIRPANANGPSTPDSFEVSDAEELVRTMNSAALDRQKNSNYKRDLDHVEELGVRMFALKLEQDATANSRNLAGVSVTNSTSSVPWGALLVGDIMHIDNKKFFNLYAMHYSHSGIYNGNNTVFESVADGVMILPIPAWQQEQPVALGYTRNRSHSQVIQALNWAKSAYGTDGRTPYNFNFLDKSTDSSLYCSQLVWKVHQHMGVDVDSNHWLYSLYLTTRYGAVGTAFAYLAVAPDEIYLSAEIIYFHAD